MKNLILFLFIFVGTQMAISQDIYNAPKEVAQEGGTFRNEGAKPDFQRFRIAVYGGYSQRLSKLHEDIPAEWEEYYTELKKGNNFCGDFSYFFTESFGLGAKFSRFSAYNSPVDIYLEDEEGNRRYGKQSDDVAIPYFAPMISGRFYNKDKKLALRTSLSLGYLGYRNDQVVIDEYIWRSGTLGLGLDLGLELGMSEEVAFLIQISYQGGSLFSFTLDDGTSKDFYLLEPGNWESLGRIDLSLGLVVGF